VIIFGVLFVFYLLRRERPCRQFIMSFFWGLPLSLAIAAIWYGPMIARHGYTFIEQFIIQHHFARFATNKYHHPQPIYFYSIVLLVLILPWTIALVASLFSTRRWKWRGATAIDRVRVLALVWLIVPLVFFSISRSKLPGYILPVLPACALLIGERIACFCREHRGEKVVRATGVLLIVLSAAAAWSTSHFYQAPTPSIAIALIVPMLVGLIALVLPKLRETIFLLIGCAVIASSLLSLRSIAPTIAANESVRDLLSAADQRGYSSLPIVQVHTVERTAEFYAANRITYGNDGEPVKFEGANQVIDAARRNGGRVLCLVPTKYVAQVTTSPNAQSEILADNGRVCLVVVTVK
jgi:4-amino-4-deoxy-L-arabinose transferase-like glycosyltransferase